MTHVNRVHSSIGVPHAIIQTVKNCASLKHMMDHYDMNVKVGHRFTEISLHFTINAYAKIQSRVVHVNLDNMDHLGTLSLIHLGDFVDNLFGSE